MVQVQALAVDIVLCSWESTCTCATCTFITLGLMQDETFARCYFSHGTFHDPFLLYQNKIYWSAFYNEMRFTCIVIDQYMYVC